jgi:sugar lactone lactonase YvrE
MRVSKNRIRRASAVCATLLALATVNPAVWGTPAGASPRIESVTPNEASSAGGAEVTLVGANFAPDSRLVVGDTVASEVTVESATRIRFTVPAQPAPGLRTISVITGDGVAQSPLLIRPKAVSELAAGEVTTIAGGITYVGDGGPATGDDVDVTGGGSLAVDAAGNIYIPDSHNHRIRRVDAETHVITTVAGTGVVGYDGDNGPAIAAKLTPSALALDAAGNLFVADADHHCVRRIDAQTGVITRVAGTGTAGYSGDGGAARAAKLNVPYDVAFDRDGNLLIADSYNNVIRRVDGQTGLISTVAGTGEYGFGGDRGPARAAKLAFPIRVAVDASNNLFIADNDNRRTRLVSARTGKITTFAGTGEAGYGGDGRRAKKAKLATQGGLEVDPQGNVLIAETDYNRLRRVDRSTKIITTVLGNGLLEHSGDGGPATSAGLPAPAGLCVDAAGNVYVTDGSSFYFDGDHAAGRIRRLDAATGIVTTVAGNDRPGMRGDGGDALGADLRTPDNVLERADGTLLICDSGNHRIAVVNSEGIITTAFGTGHAGFSGDGGPAAEAQFYAPRGMALDAAGNIYVADQYNNRVRVIDAATGIVTTVAGTGEPGFGGDGGRATLARLNQPIAVAVDPAGDLVVADLLNNRVRKIDSATGRISTVAGNGGEEYDGDGDLATRKAVHWPTAVAFDASNNMVVAEYFNRVRRVDARTGRITTLAGDGTFASTGNGGPASEARVGTPYGLAFDGDGNLFISEAYPCRVRRVDGATGIITAVAGFLFAGYRGDGGAATSASFFVPRRVTVGRSGDLYICDGVNNAVRAIRGIAVPPR